MSTSKKTQKELTTSEIVEAYFDEKASDEIITASELAELVNRDAKTVRARLRKLAVRDQSQFKNATWRITETIAESELEHYLKQDAKNAS